MALRSRSRTATATSGPGRSPASDGRVRHRRPRSVARGRAAARHRHPSGEELRRRAEALFGERAEPPSRADPGEPAGERRESGQGPPGEGPPGEGRLGPGARGPVSPGPGLPGSGGGDEARAGVDPGGGRLEEDWREGDRREGHWRERAGLALRERMPLWLQTRCGLERRSVLALTVVLVVAAAFAVQHFWAGRTQTVRPPEVVRAAARYGEEPGQDGRAVGPPGSGAAAGAAMSTGTAAASGTAGTLGTTGTAGTSGTAEIVVDVSGKVRDPGIHRLPAGSRVADALRAAGGVKPGTDTDGLNRARFLVDGEQVIVGGAAPVAGAGAAAGAGSTGAAGSVGGASGGALPGAPVSLNTATLDQLDTLPGVGPVLAQHIVDYRTQHGGFRSVDELREVNGIGDRRFADLRNLVRP
ncbi:helix-hairpin-helix domain-containing protein [Streptomyces sp. NPDC085932]|uniref:helix-hairpin-helix domain-containing protein n=1 Tax=Streptomyces sp. NPDC085932 TaxID=3365741 RepID=UPI0037D52E68